LTANVSAKSRVLPKAFKEKGLYMLATILKGIALRHVVAKYHSPMANALGFMQIIEICALKWHNINIAPSGHISVFMFY